MRINLTVFSILVFFFKKGGKRVLSCANHDKIMKQFFKHVLNKTTKRERNLIHFGVIYIGIDLSVKFLRMSKLERTNFTKIYCLFTFIVT